MEAHTGKRVTAADVARSLGLSRATVGFALNDTPGQRISEATRQRVVAEAARLGYRPHTAAQALRRGSSKVILLVVPDWPFEFSIGRYVEEASLALEEAGYSLVTQNRHAAGIAQPLWELLDPEVVVGFMPFSDEELAAMRSRGITKVIPDPERPQSLPEANGLDNGPRLQVGHLHERGDRRLGFAATADPRLSTLVESRLCGAQKAAGALGLEPLDVRTVDEEAGSAEPAIRRWIDIGVTGVVAYNDDAAARVIRATVRAGFAVPEDLAVIGHDDSPYTSMFIPSISTVRVDYAGLGRQVAALALHEATGRPMPTGATEIATTVIARESTEPPQA